MSAIEHRICSKTLVFSVVEGPENFCGKKRGCGGKHNIVYFAINNISEVTSVLVNMPVSLLGNKASWYRMTHIHTIESLLTYKTFP